MQIYRFLFACELCGRELIETVTCTELLAKKELHELRFHLRCIRTDCEWKAERSGLDAKRITVALKPMQICD
jgi:hypothetical protein